MEIKETTIDDLVLSIVKAQGILEETEAEIKVLKDEISDRLTASKLTGIKTGNGYFVNKITSTLFTGVELSTARDLGATQTIEKLDTTKLKKIYEAGVKIKGVKLIQYIKIKEANE